DWRRSRAGPSGYAHIARLPPVYEALIHVGPRRRVVDTAGRKRGASQDPPHRQRRSTERPELAHGLLGILRTTGVEAAVAPERLAQRQTVQTDHEQLGHPERGAHSPGQRLHALLHRSTPAAVNRCSRSALTSDSFAERISGRATIITSHPSRTRPTDPRQASFISRRARFRKTAPPLLGG